MLNTKNQSFGRLCVGLLTLYLGTTYATAATDLTPLFSVYEQGCGYIDSSEAEQAAETYNDFKDHFIAHEESTTDGVYNGTVFSTKKNYTLPAPYKQAISSITMKKGDDYDSNSITYTVNFNDATYRNKPVSHLDIYLIPNSDMFYDALYLKASPKSLKSHFKYKQFEDDPYYDNEKVGAYIDASKNLILCDAIVGSYK